MFNIPFRGNSKVFDLLQVTKLTKVGRLLKTFQRGLYLLQISKGPLFTPSQTIQKMYCIVQVDGGKESILLVLGQ